MFAVTAHKGVKRKGDGRPYILHPTAVMHRIYDNKPSKNMYLLMACAVLHDTVEDCPDITHNVLEARFGPDVAKIVSELTNDKHKMAELGKSNYMLLKMNTMSSYALCLKLCDILENVLDVRNAPKKLVTDTHTRARYILKNLDRPLTKTHKRLIKQIKQAL